MEGAFQTRLQVVFGGVFVGVKTAGFGVIEISGRDSSNICYSDIRTKIKNDLFSEAEILLDSIPEQSRTAEWFFLKGSILYRKCWLEEASGNFAAACRMDPDNIEYSDAYDNMGNSSSGEYRTDKSKIDRCLDCYCINCCGDSVCDSVCDCDC